jgi:hypothetical protein
LYILANSLSSVNWLVLSLPLHGHVEHLVIGGEGGGVDELVVVDGEGRRVRLHHDDRVCVRSGLRFIHSGGGLIGFAGKFDGFFW